MYSVFITLALFIICILGRMTNALMFSGIMKSHQTRSPLWLALDFTSGCLCLTIIAQFLLLIGYFTGGLTLSLLIFCIFLELALIITRNRLAYVVLSYKYVCFACLIGVAAAFMSIHEPGFWDDTSYHLIVARDFANNGDLTANLFLRYPYTPFNVDVLFAICFFAAGFDPVYSVYGCQALATAPLFLIILLLWGTVYRGTRSLTCATGALALFFAFYKTSVTIHLGYAYVDNLAALFTFSAFSFLLFAHYHKCEPRFYILPGAICGLVAGCKYQCAAIIFIVMMSVVVAMVLHRKWKNMLFFSLSVIIFSSYWYIRNFIQNGNPVDPFLIGIFGSDVWSPADFLANASDIRYLRPRGFGAILSNSLWALILVWAVILVRIVSILRRMHSNQSLKIQFLDCVTIGLAVYSLLWAELFPIPRYLLPALGILIFCTVIIISRYLRKFNFLVVLVMLICALSWRMTLSSPFSWDRYAKQRELFETASALSGSRFDRALTIEVQERNKYFFTGVTVGDLYGNARFTTFYTPGTEKLLPPENFLKSMEHWKAKFAIVSNKVLHSSRINDFKRLFHIIKYNPGALGGILMVPLKPISACKWSGPHSSWAETNVLGNVFSHRDHLRIFLNSEAINEVFCNKNSQEDKYILHIRLGEFNDWKDSQQSMRIYHSNGRELSSFNLKDLPVEYDEDGKRSRIIRLVLNQKDILKKLQWIELYFEKEDVQDVPKIRMDQHFIRLDPL